MDENHPVIIAMCDAFHGKAAKHKKMRRIAMLRAFQAAQDYYSQDLRGAVACLGEAILRVGQRGAAQ